MSDATGGEVSGFEFDGLRAGAASSFASDLDWLEEFLCPQFQRVDAAAATCVVQFTRDPLRFADLSNTRADAEEKVIDCFVLDQQVIRLPSWHGPDGAFYILDAKFHCVYVVDSARSTVEIVASTRRRGPRIPAMRILREFAMNHSLSQGRLFIHGAAVGIGASESGVLIAGPSGSGKTTLLMHLLSLADASYVSNDRVMVRPGPRGPLLTGMPAITTLRSTTLDHYPAIRSALTGSPFNHQRTIAESEEAAVPIKPWSDSRYGLTPAQFCRLMGVPSRAQVSPKAVLVPRHTQSPGHISLKRLSPDTAERRLGEAIFGVGCWSHETNVFALPDDRAVISADELHRRCHQFAASLPVFECELGLQAYDDPASTRDLLDHLCT